MITHKEYMANSSELFRPYHAQFVDTAMKRRIRQPKFLQACLASTDPHLNDIPLIEWDNIVLYSRSFISRKLKEAGTFWSLATGVCVAKEAARQVMEEIQ